jgi:uncharacterized protein YaeQ
MSRTLTDEACKSIIRRIALRLGVDAKLITTRLMSEDDKNDMRKGDISKVVLELHVKLWIENGMPDYVNIHKKEGTPEGIPDLIK